MQWPKKPVWQPILAIILIGGFAYAMSLWFLYNAAYRAQLRNLEHSVQILANVLEAVAQHDMGLHIDPKSSIKSITMNQLMNGLKRSKFQTYDMELVIGYRDNDILKLVHKTEQGYRELDDVPYDGKLAQPMYHALKNRQHGSAVMSDYAGEEAMAGYAYVPSLDVALVFKIPLSQMQAPFITSALWGASVQAIMLGLLISGFIYFRQRHKQQLYGNEHRFESIIENIPSMIFMKRASDLSYVLFNRAAENLTGISKNEVMGKNDFDLFSAEQAKLFTDRDRRMLGYTDYEDVLEEEISTKYNGDRILHTRKLCIRDDEGKPEYLLGISEDITEQKKNQELLETTNQLLNTILDSAPVLIAYLDPEFNFIRVNRAYAEADHKRADYFIGLNHFELFPNEENKTIFESVLENGEAYHCKARAFEYSKNPERGITHWDWSLVPVKNNAGEILGLIFVLMNVTDHIEALEALEMSQAELKQLNESLDLKVHQKTQELQEQIFRNTLILETCQEGYFAGEESGRLCAVNPAFCEMLGYSKSELLNMYIYDLEANEDKEVIKAHIEKIAIDGRDVFDTRYRCKNGKIIDVEVSVKLVEISEEKVFYAFVRNISQRIKNEKELVAARDAAEQASQAKSEFLSRMSHELRTPMNAILGFAQIMQLQSLTSTQKDYIEEIQDAGDHLLILINELLDLARIENGKLSMSIEPVEVASTISQAVKMIDSLLQDKNIHFVNECKRDVFMLVDKTRILQILVNLLSNSVKYNKYNGTVTLSCDMDDMFLRIFITDTGMGMSEANVSKLFQSFERLGAEYTNIEGTGIGLAVSKQLAKLMGGDIGVHSELGKGSTFWVEIPGAPSGVPLGERVFDDSLSNKQVGNGKQIVLYIEDNAANLKVVEALFEFHENLNLLSATTGMHGLEIARKYLPDVILLDIHLPDIDGFEVIRGLKSNPSTVNIPVVALSADAMPIDIERALDTGFNDYLTKPIDLQKLMSTLDRFLQN